MNFTIQLIRGDDAHQYRIKDEFIHAWKDLAQQTNHVSVFQEPEFVNPWYDEYRSTFEPVLVLGVTDSQKITGIIPLAVEHGTNNLHYAGAQHVEYSGWLCDPAIDQEFILPALATIRRKIPFTRWRWQFTPPRANISWLLSEQTRRIGVHILYETLDSPLLDLHQEEKLKKVLKNKSVKSKINRLKRKGELKIERITSKDRVLQLMNQIEILVNFRHGAAHHDAAFEEDSTQKLFYQARGNYLENNHFSVLWLGEKLLAFNFGAIDNDTAYIGLTAFDPTESKHSPGVIFFIYLAKLLKEEGIRYIDLTPGGDEYKERFSNKHYALYRPTFYSSRTLQLVDKYKRNTTQAISKTLSKLGLNPRDRRYELSAHNSSSSNQVLKFDLYSLNREDYQQDISNNRPEVAIQSFQDLLLFDSFGNHQNRYEVLSDATKRFSKEETVFTIKNNQHLTAFSWSSKPGAQYRNHGITFTPGKQDIVLDCLDLNQQLPDEASFTTMLHTMLEHAFSQEVNCAHLFMPTQSTKEFKTSCLNEIGFKKAKNN